MKNTQRGSVSLIALLFASFLLSLGGAGAAASYFQKNPDDFLAQLHTYFNSRVDAEEPAPTVTPTPTASDTITLTPTATPTPDETPTPTPEVTLTPTPTPGEKPSINGVHGSDEEEIHESNTAKIHEHEHGKNIGITTDTDQKTEIED
jgi:hypothetical protein